MRFLLRRALFSALAVLGATILVFAVARALGDPRYLLIGDSLYGTSAARWDALGRQLHLDKPVIVQYFFWLSGVVRGDLGTSLYFQQSVSSLIRERLPNTLRLALAAWAFATILGVGMGVLSAVKRGGKFDYAARFFALIGLATPGFWMGVMAIFLFSFILGWLPAFGMGEGLSIRHLILPAIVFGWTPAGIYLRLTRSAMLEVLDSEYVKFARSKGINPRKVIWKHAFRNALLTPLTASAFVLLGFATGSVIAETVFSWPGIGSLVVLAARGNDTPMLLGTTLVFVVMYVGAVFVLDLVYTFLDPRIRYD